MKNLIEYLLLFTLTVGSLITAGCGTENSSSQPSNTQADAVTPSPASATVSPAPVTAPASDKVREANQQITAIISNVKAWKEKGHSYKQLSLERAIANGLFPKEMINQNTIPVNPWGATVDIGPAPTSMGDTFLIVFSGVPNADCVRLAFPPNNNFKIYAGNFIDTNVPTSEDQAKSFCITGNMWFVPK